MKRIKKFFGDFKKFISRGNILDMAVGVIIGGAFSAIVTALTNKIIMPLINLLLSIGGENGLESAVTILKPGYTDGVLDLAKSIYIDWGAFITAIIDFFLIAFVLFIILKSIMNASNMFKQTIAEQTNKELKAEKKQIRKLAKAENRKYKEVWSEHLAEKKRIAEEKAKAEEDARKKKEEEEKLLHPSQEELLKGILEELRKQNAEVEKSSQSKEK